MSIPCLLVLKSLEEDDKGICKKFMPDMYSEESQTGCKYGALKKLFFRNKINEYERYNLVEKMILEVELSESDKKSLKSIDPSELDQVMHRIKELAIEMSRVKPT